MFIIRDRSGEMQVVESLSGYATDGDDAVELLGECDAPPADDHVFDPKTGKFKHCSKAAGQRKEREANSPAELRRRVDELARRLAELEAKLAR